ncbi:MAG TPA: hypothetical protein VEU75_05845 [Candidatus Acidoferrum sp.]|nr:hypothetical protein [Candidatus Acidoferrum sp.]
MAKIVSRNRNRAPARAHDRFAAQTFDYEHECEYEIRPTAILTNPGQDWLQEEGPCEIQPVGAGHLSVGPPPAPAARGWDLNYNQREKERRLMQAEQKLTAVS